MVGSRHVNLKVTYRKRGRGLLKKARELSILCGIQVLLICISPAGAVNTWPNDVGQVLDAIARYRGCSHKRKDDLITHLLKQASKMRAMDPDRQTLADLAQRAASKLEEVRIRIRILTNTSNVSESNRDEGGVENITNPPQSSTTVESISEAESTANNDNVQHQQQYYHYAYVPILLWPQIPASPEKRTPVDNVPKGGGEAGEVDTQLRHS